MNTATQPKILVVFYSMTGNVAALARAVADGAEKEGAEVRMRQVTDTLPQSVIDSHPEIKKAKAELKPIPFATLDDLKWADGVAFGSPTRYGNMSSQLKQFIDTTGSLWMSGELVGKVASVFTSTATQHGGQETTLLSMMVPLFHLGFILQGLPYTEKGQIEMNSIHGGSPYGASSVTGLGGNFKSSEVDLAMASTLGKRLAQTTSKQRANVENKIKKTA